MRNINSYVVLESENGFGSWIFEVREIFVWDSHTHCIERERF